MRERKKKKKKKFLHFVDKLEIFNAVSERVSVILQVPMSVLPRFKLDSLLRSLHACHPGSDRQGVTLHKITDTCKTTENSQKAFKESSVCGPASPRLVEKTTTHRVIS